ncbi:unnamed protein product [Didymodactylos carnosus]|uniref:Uncharacterized protein n=1 Tax=Didymodactylos carnosus TaxID=1234261 RepID=A0A815NVW2_9BILA|nr:unnamed protein product [Didymodactylos carnosus]CAF4315055.1 unnamed protein product [Didymodactylos carnosus]
MTKSSKVIINTYLNSIQKTDLRYLSRNELLSLIEKFAEVVDSDCDDSLDSIANCSLDVANPLFKTIVAQHDLLIRTLCHQYQSKANLLGSACLSPQSNASSSQAFVSNRSTQTQFKEFCSPSTVQSNHSLSSISCSDSIMSPNHDINHTGDKSNNSNPYAAVVTSSPIPPTSLANMNSSKKADSTSPNSNPLLSQKSFIHPTPVLVTVTGSSITQDLEPSTVNLKNKPYRFLIRTKKGCTIEQMTEYLQDKHFQPSPHFVMNIGTINLKHDDPGIALDKTKLLVQSFKKSYPQSSLALTTLSPLLVRGTKSSVDHVRNDITEYNRLLTSIDGVDIIKVNYDDRSMVCVDGIHLSDSGTRELSRSIDDYFSRYI